MRLWNFRSELEEYCDILAPNDNCKQGAMHIPMWTMVIFVDCRVAIWGEIVRSDYAVCSQEIGSIFNRCRRDVYGNLMGLGWHPFAFRHVRRESRCRNGTSVYSPNDFEKIGENKSWYVHAVASNDIDQ
jgi:hypothetical protein